MRILRMLELVTAGVERRLWIADAYFLSVPILTQSLVAAARDGVDVRILLPATNDLPWIGALSRAGYRQLLQAGVGIFEYSGLMMHAKTTVADGWWSRIGSTNLNISGLFANWEVDLIVEDGCFGAKMEAMFEEDVAYAREIRLGGTPRHPKVQPEHSVTAAERRAQRRTPGTGSRAAATARRVGGTAVRQGTDPVLAHERAVSAVLSAGLLGISVLGLRFPRLISWPLSAASGLLGASGLLRAAHLAKERDH